MPIANYLTQLQHSNISNEFDNHRLSIATVLFYCVQRCPDLPHYIFNLTTVPKTIISDEPSIIAFVVKRIPTTASDPFPYAFSIRR